MRRRWEISRRWLLRGAGASVALPLLDAMQPGVQRARAAGEGDCRRWVMWHFPTGYNEARWTVNGPGDGGTDWEPSPSLQPLADLGIQEHVSVIEGTSAPYSDGAGAGHTCGISGQLSGILCSRQEVAVNGRTIDQEIAARIGATTPIPSLQLGTSILHENPNDEPGYAAGIKDHLSWANESTPLPKQIDPARVFERLFGADDVDPESVDSIVRVRVRQSVLDHVLREASTLQNRLGSADRRKVDQYLTHVREVEQGIQAAPRNDESGACDAQGRAATFHAPDDIEDHVRQMNRLMVLALQCDATRVIVFQYENTVTRILHPFLDVNQPYHIGVTHHGGNATALHHYFLVNRWLVSQFGDFVRMLHEIPEGEGTLLDATMAIMTSEIGDGDAHDHVRLPCLLAGRAGGVRSGRHFDREGLFMHVLIATAQAVGADIGAFGRAYPRPTPIEGPYDGLLPS